MAATAGALKSLFPPLRRGVPPFYEVGRLGVGLERRLVLVDLIEPNTVRVGSVLDYVEPQAAGLVVHRAFGVVQQRLNELGLVPLFDLYRRDDDVHCYPPPEYRYLLQLNCGGLQCGLHPISEILGAHAQ